MKGSIQFAAAVLVLAAIASAADAGWRARRASTCTGGSCASGYQSGTVDFSKTVSSPAGTVTQTYHAEHETFVGGGSDALAEVNAKRAARGLRPFLHDPALTQAAQACASERARRRLFGHTENDFRFLPGGSRAASAGCAAYPASYGWMSCCTYENYTYAGAAYVVGPDNKRYMHLFVR